VATLAFLTHFRKIAATLPSFASTCSGLCFGVLLLLFVFPPSIVAEPQGHEPTETQVEAAYLFNFAKFVRWRAGDESFKNLQICVLGRNPFGTVLESTVRGESINGRAVSARTVVNLQEASGCQIIFVSESEAGRLDAILNAIRHQDSLTVSDIPHFAERGGMIEFVREEDRIRFKVNLTPMAEGDIGVSSELLKVAIKVIGRSGGAK
jgi:hypothetical protein